MNVWRLIVHHENKKKAREWYEKTNKIAIGWGFIGDLSKVKPKNKAEITAMIGNHKEYATLTNAGSGGPILWNFYVEMEIGDLVIIGDGHKRHFVVRVIGDYEWNNKHNHLMEPDYYHQRTAEHTPEYDPDELWEKYGPQANGENIRWALIRCQGKP